MKKRSLEELRKQFRPGGRRSERRREVEKLRETEAAINEVILRSVICVTVLDEGMMGREGEIVTSVGLQSRWAVHWVSPFKSHDKVQEAMSVCHKIGTLKIARPVGSSHTIISGKSNHTYHQVKFIEVDVMEGHVWANSAQEAHEFIFDRIPGAVHVEGWPNEVILRPSVGPIPLGLNAGWVDPMTVPSIHQEVSQVVPWKQ